MAESSEKAQAERLRELSRERKSVIAKQRRAAENAKRVAELNKLAEGSW